MRKILILASKAILDQSEHANKKTHFGDSKHYNLKTELKMKILGIIRNIHIQAFIWYISAQLPFAEDSYSEN